MNIFYIAHFNTKSDKALNIEEIKDDTLPLSADKQDILDKVTILLEIINHKIFEENKKKMEELNNKDEIYLNINNQNDDDNDNDVGYEIERMIKSNKETQELEDVNKDLIVKYPLNFLNLNYDDIKINDIGHDLSNALEISLTDPTNLDVLLWLNTFLQLAQSNDFIEYERQMRKQKNMENNDDNDIKMNTNDDDMKDNDDIKDDIKDDNDNDYYLEPDTSYDNLTDLPLRKNLLAFIEYLSPFKNMYPTRHDWKRDEFKINDWDGITNDNRDVKINDLLDRDEIEYEEEYSDDDVDDKAPDYEKRREELMRQIPQSKDPEITVYPGEHFYVLAAYNKKEVSVIERDSSKDKNKFGIEFKCSTNYYTTLMGNFRLLKGKWYYEVKIGSSGNMGVGWCLYGKENTAKFDYNNPVGYNDKSWCFDGYSVCKWHNKQTQPFGQKWNVGDIIGISIDLKIISIFIIHKSF